ncbi:hypothetical protein HK097_011237, partial [Rhizophlyctis rosea]
MNKAPSEYSSRSGSSRRRQKQKGWRGKFDRYKNAIFEMLYAIQKADTNPPSAFWVYFGWLVEWIQYFAFCYIDIEWGPHGDAFGNIIVWTQLEQQVATKLKYEVMQVMVYVCVVLVAILAAMYLYVISSFISKDFKAGVWPLRLVRTLSSILQTFLYVPVLAFLLGGAKCPHDESVECWKGAHLPLASCSIIAICVFLPLAMLSCLSYFDPNPLSKDLKAQSLPFSEMLELIGKTILIVLENVSQEYALPRALGTFFVFFVLTTTSYITFPFTHRSSSLFRCLSTAQILFFSTFAIIVAVRPQHNSNVLFYVSLAITPLTLAVSYCIFRWRWNRMISKERVVNALKAARMKDVEGRGGEE